MTETRVFQRPETVPLHAEVKNWSGSYVNPSTIKITITNPLGVEVVTDIDMTSEGTGKFVYYYRPTADAALGWYRASAEVVDGAGATAITTLTPGGFRME